MRKLNLFLRSKPLFLYLLPVFFVFHNYIENFHYTLTKEAIELVAEYLSISLIIACLFWFLFRSFYKASLLAFFIMALNFFFGSFHDFLKQYFANTFIIKYSFLIAIAIILLTILLVYLKKKKQKPIHWGLFLNYLLILLISIDAITFSPRIFKGKIEHVKDVTKDFVSCDTCTNPDIYLIIADEYAGKESFKHILLFDNSDFENQLKRRGFHLSNNTTSNYNTTVYSMASMLSMDYLTNMEQAVENQRDIFICRELIKNNNLIHFLKSRGYQSFNYSMFEFDDKKKHVTNPFYASKKQLFTSQTFLERFWKNIGYNFISEKQIKSGKDRHLYNTIKIDSSTRRTADKQTAFPKIVYSHLPIPHLPYYFDSTGNRTKYSKLSHSYPQNENSYIQYLVYTNKKLLSLIDYIKLVSRKPPIIILMSDHGFRQFNDSVSSKYYFMNLNAVYFPNGNYSGFYDGISNVNQFRVILNSQFGQNLPLLKDSTSFIR